MNTATLHFFSKALNHHVTYNVILPSPELGPGPFPVLYQLHGLTDDHTAWLRSSNLIRHAAKFPFIIVLPDGGTSFYLNWNPRERYEDFMINDLPTHVANTFHVKPGKAAIGGLSMGGYGSLRLALKYPELFASVWAHSSAAFDAQHFRERFACPPEDLVDADLFALAASHKDAALPRITFDCGTEDSLLENNRRFHAHLTELGISHDYFEYPGAHEWPYWDLHVQSALKQHAQVFGFEVSSL